MKVKEMKVSLCERKEIREFIEKWHYSRNINGLKSSYCFKLTYNDEIIGAMIYGRLGMASVWKRYAETELEVMELRRLCCIDDTPKNTESYFIGHTLRWLKKNSPTKTVVSYADPFHGHAGTIYKATNFTCVGTSLPGEVIMWNGRGYHEKAVRTYYLNTKGEKIIKPFALRLQAALDNGEASLTIVPGKLIYTYKLV